MMSSTTGAEAVCARSLFSQPHLASLLAVEKGFVGHFFSSFSALSFFFVKQTQQHLEPHVFHGHLTIKSRCCQSHKIIVAEWTLEHMCATRSIIVIMKADFFYCLDEEPEILNATEFPALWNVATVLTQSIDAPRSRVWSATLNFAGAPILWLYGWKSLLS